MNCHNKFEAVDLPDEIDTPAAPSLRHEQDPAKNDSTITLVSDHVEDPYAGSHSPVSTKELATIGIPLKAFTIHVATVDEFRIMPFLNAMESCLRNEMMFVELQTVTLTIIDAHTSLEGNQLETNLVLQGLAEFDNDESTPEVELVHDEQKHALANYNTVQTYLDNANWNGDCVSNSPGHKSGIVENVTILKITVLETDADVDRAFDPLVVTLQSDGENGSKTSNESNPKRSKKVNKFTGNVLCCMVTLVAVTLALMLFVARYRYTKVSR